MAMATRAAYGKALAKLVQENQDVVVLDADLAGSTKTGDAKAVCPQRHFDMGIAEGNMMGVAAGLAASGKIAYASSFAMFAAGRAFEQIRNSICYPNLNVKVCATHAGITVGEDGASHQSVEDLALMRSIPNMKVFQPCDAEETKQIIEGIAKIDGPCYVRLGRSSVEDVDDESLHWQPGKGSVLKEGSKVAIVATGMMVQESLKAAKEMEGIEPTIVNISSLKPIDEELIKKLAKEHEVIVTAEEHSVIGGLGSAVAEVLAKEGSGCRLKMIGLNDEFGQSGKPKDLLAYYGLDASSIAKKIMDFVQ